MMALNVICTRLKTQEDRIWSLLDVRAYCTGILTFSSSLNQLDTLGGILQRPYISRRYRYLEKNDGSMWIYEI